MSLPERVGFADFILLPAEKRLLRSDGTVLPLSPRLFTALCLFIEHAGRLLDKDALMRGLWPGLVVEENSLNQVVASLRRALGDDAHRPHLIETVPRYGFRFVADVHDLSAGPQPPAHGAPTTARPASGAEAPDVSTPAASSRTAAPQAARNGRRRWLALGAAVSASAAVAGWAGWRLWRHGEPGAPPVSLAVLPFMPLGAEPRDELLEIGMADSIAARLSTLPGLAVLSTGSVLRYAGAARDPAAAARELGADWVVDGSLQRRGEQLRATARLLRATDGRATWSGSFDARYGGVFEMQDQIAARVHEALAPSLQGPAPAAVSLAEPGGTHDPRAYQLYLAASWRGQGGGPSSIERAIELLQQALAIDPGYAQAWTELAWAHRRRLWNADAEPADVFGSANVALSRALALVPELPQAHAGLGFTHYWFDFDWPAAEREFRGALARNANVVAAHWGLTNLLLTQGRIDEGLVHLRRSRELDPMSPLFNTMEAAYLTDRGALDEARDRLAIAFDLAPGLWLAHVAQGQLWLALKQPQQAIDALRKAVELGPGTSRPRAVLAAHLARLGQHDEARGILAALQAQASRRHVPPTSLAMILAALGQTTAALDALDEAYRWRDARLIFLKDDPAWRRLREEPRFVALMRRLKLDRLPPGLTPV
jgi:TolB-like protein/DNA-binding winged helix-turn-helix (wHTH) protein/tetratricopeptide (TPR) repeat protein